MSYEFKLWKNEVTGNDMITATEQNSQHTYTIVDYIPDNYVIWRNLPEGYFTLCMELPEMSDIGVCKIRTDNLLAISFDDFERLLYEEDENAIEIMQEYIILKNGTTDLAPYQISICEQASDNFYVPEEIPSELYFRYTISRYGIVVATGWDSVEKTKEHSLIDGKRCYEKIRNNMIEYLRKPKLAEYSQFTYDACIGLLLSDTAIYSYLQDDWEDLIVNNDDYADEIEAEFERFRKECKMLGEYNNNVDFDDEAKYTAYFDFICNFNLAGTDLE